MKRRGGVSPPGFDQAVGAQFIAPDPIEPDNQARILDTTGSAPDDKDGFKYVG